MPVVYNDGFFAVIGEAERTNMMIQIGKVSRVFV